MLLRFGMGLLRSRTMSVCPTARDLVALAGLAVVACTSPSVPDERSATSEAASSAQTPTPQGTPFLRVLGTAQDGGFPHAACEHELCRRARLDDSLASYVASLGLVLPQHGGGNRVFLVDATPDIRDQLDLLRDVRDLPQNRVDRAPVDGVLLTHAHIGHYLGLAFFGFEAVHTRDLPVFATARMAAFLRANGPWGQLVTKGNIALVEQAPGTRFTLGAAADGATVEVEMLAVPHRDEYSDTVGFLFAGPNRTVLYVPDTDGWAAWRPPLREVLDRLQVDVAILDASFYSLDELPGRDLASVRHPLVTQTMELLADWVAAGGEVVLSHLNHSNPALDPSSEARAAIEAAGFEVATLGQAIGL